MEAARRAENAQRAADYSMRLRIAMAPHTEHPQKTVNELYKDIQRLVEAPTGVYQPQSNKLDRAALNAIKKSMRR